MAERTVTLREKTSFHLGKGDRKAQGWPWPPVGMVAEAPQIHVKGGEDTTEGAGREGQYCGRVGPET